MRKCKLCLNILFKIQFKPKTEEYVLCTYSTPVGKSFHSLCLNAFGLWVLKVSNMKLNKPSD